MTRRTKIKQRSCATLEQLHNEMKATHQSPRAFKIFKENVRQHANTLDLVKLIDDQQKDSTEWAAFVDHMLASEPLLSHYEDLWPFTTYLRLYCQKKLSKMRHPKRRIAKSLSKARYESRELEILDVVTNYPNTRSRKSNGRSLQAKEARQRSASSDVEIVRVVTKQTTYLRERPSDIFFRAFYEDHPALSDSSGSHNQPTYVTSEPSRPTCHTSSKENIAPVRRGPKSRSQLEKFISVSTSNMAKKIQTMPPISIWPEKSTPITVSCIRCDASTVADSLYNARLRAFVNDERLLSQLATVGIRFDHHLDILLRMKQATLKMFFFESVPSVKMDVSLRSQLLRLFSNFGKPVTATAATGISGSGTRPADVDSTEYILISDDDEEIEDLVLIRPPLLDVEVAMVHCPYLDFKDDLQSAMKLDDDNVKFQALLDTIEYNLGAYSSSSTPDKGLLEGVIKRIADTKHDQLKRYTNYWPAMICLRRLQNIVPNICPQNTIEEEAKVFADIYTEKTKVSSPASKTTRRTRPPKLEPKFKPSLRPTSALPKATPIIEQLPCPGSLSPTPSLSSSSGSQAESQSQFTNRHPPIDTTQACPALRAYLHAQNMGELIPVFVYMGVCSEREFEAFRKIMTFLSTSSTAVNAAASELSSSSSSVSQMGSNLNTELSSILTSPALCRLGDFQKFLLGIAFDVDRGVYHFD